MKVLMICGSPRKEGNTYTALKELEKTLNEEGIETEIVSIGTKGIQGCIGCATCMKTKKCVFDDIVNEIAVKFRDADGLVIGSPVYFASANGSLISLLDRLFYSAKFDKTMKVGAAVAVARRGGTTATFDELNKYFTWAGMPVASSQYWNVVHGGAPGQAAEDIEGMQIMRTLGRNMAFLIKSIQLGKEKYGIPERETWTPTNFIR